jgi:NAD(P)-dependent dehydrogenase (short-subunit alcohol dehydrogenase family)
VTLRPHTVVIGGTRGIGRTLVRHLASDHHTVSVIGRSKPLGFDRLPRVRAWSADVADGPRLQRALSDIVRRQGRVSGAVLLQRYRGDNWAEELATTVTATRQMLDWAGEHLADRGEGKAIVVVSSVAAWYVASEQPASYHAAKAAVSQLVRYYAVALGPKGIRVNAIAPGTIVKEESKAFYKDHPALEQLYREIVPLGRMGTADDVAHLALFLLSARASFVTGQNITLDGGVSLQWHESLARRVTPMKDMQVSRPRGEIVRPGKS